MTTSSSRTRTSTGYERSSASLFSDICNVLTAGTGGTQR